MAKDIGISIAVLKETSTEELKKLLRSLPHNGRDIKKVQTILGKRRGKENG